MTATSDPPDNAPKTADGALPDNQNATAQEASGDTRASQTAARRSGKPARFAWVTEERVLSTLYRGLLAATLIVLFLDFQTIYEEANAPLPGETERRAPLIMDPPREKDHVRPYLPRATPMRRSGKPPRMPGHAKPPMADTIGQPMRFVRGPKGKASAVGRIEPGTARRFQEFIEGQQGEVTEVFLHSPGGSVADALAMSKLLRDKNIATRVPSNAYCASSCPIVLSGGNKRTVGPGAWVGVHRIYTDSRSPGGLAEGLAEGQAVTARVQEHLINMGVDTRAWLHAMKTPSSQLYVFTAKELKDYKLATRIASN